MILQQMITDIEWGQEKKLIGNCMVQSNCSILCVPKKSISYVRQHINIVFSLNGGKYFDSILLKIMLLICIFCFLLYSCANGIFFLI